MNELYQKSIYNILKEINSNPNYFPGLSNTLHFIMDNNLIKIIDIKNPKNGLTNWENHLTFKGLWILHQLGQKYE